MQLKYLPNIESPADIKNFSNAELIELAQELRNYIIEVISEIGGHLAPTLGVIELTVALHKIFNTPEDKIIWDVGHQAYAHKLLTGRFKNFSTIRQMGGLSGFLKRSESEFDNFGAGHASTSISAAAGIAAAQSITGKHYRTVAVIGDGSMTGGLAFEGLNNAGHLRTPMLVILNDNEMSISPNVGALNTYLTRIVANPLYNRLRDEIWKLTGKLPRGKSTARTMLHRLEESFKSLVVPGMLFEELGFRYFGPIDGHNLNQLLQTLENIKDFKTPAILHIITKKGKGLSAAEHDPVNYHGVKANGKGKTKKNISFPTYQSVFGILACEIALNMKNTVCITAAMKEGTGLEPFSRKFPKRFFDVGIAEGHAVTFAAGLATEKVRPIVAIYSTFLQRAFDHMVHDVALQKLPVIFCIDRAGIAGEDGPTHHGALDISYLRSIQNMVVTAPKNGNELRHLLYTALNQETGPFSIRYAKAESVEFDEKAQGEILPMGSWEVEKTGSKAAILAVGPMVYEALEAAQNLISNNISVEVVNCRFIKPMDEAYLKSLLGRINVIITIEEGTVTGGFGEGVSAWLLKQGYNGKIKVLALPDKFVEHGSRLALLDKYDLNKKGLESAVLKLFPDPAL